MSFGRLAEERRALTKPLAAGARSLDRLFARVSMRWIVLALVLVTAICAFVPFSPAMPGAKLDESWTLGMNQAVSQGLVFGRDIVLTFGPYAAIFTKAYHPATDLMMLVGSAYLGLTYWLAIVWLTRGKRYLAWVLLLALAGFMSSRDALLMSYPLLVGLVCCQSIERLSTLPPRVVAIGIAVLCSPFGLLPLIKGSFAVLCALIAGIAIVRFAIERHWRLVLVIGVAPVVTMAVFWIAAGQPVLALPAYVHSMLPMISGYAEAMGLPGDDWEIVCFLASAVILLAGVLWDRRSPALPRRVLFATFLAFLFVVFKAGFVRHDSHALISGSSLLFAAVLFAGTVQSRLKPAVLVSAALAWMFIDVHYVESPVADLLDNVGETYSSAWSGATRRLADTGWPRREFETTLQAVNATSGVPRLAGTTDVYSYGQAALIASGNAWNPRPVIQSYAVYDRGLDAMNREHLRGAAAPDNILFRVETIDSRLPPLDDGGSWPALLTRYLPVSFEHDWLVLHRRAAAVPDPALTTIATSSHRLGWKVPVPEVPDFVFAEIELSPTLLGRLVGALFKPSELVITLTLTNGQPKTYRFIASMARLTILLSPLVETTQEFATLYGGNGYLGGKQVTSFMITSPDSAREWQRSFRVTYRKLARRAVVNPRQFYALDAPVAGDAVGDDGIDVVTCGGNIDVVNGMAPPPGDFAATGLLGVSGWLTPAAPAALPDVVRVVLTGSDGRHRVFTTHHTKRPDVARYFSDPKLEASGYETTVDASALDGRYALGLAYMNGDRLELCAGSKYSMTLTAAAIPEFRATDGR